MIQRVFETLTKYDGVMRQGICGDTVYTIMITDTLDGNIISSYSIDTNPYHRYISNIVVKHKEVRNINQFIQTTIEGCGGCTTDKTIVLRFDCDGNLKTVHNDRDAVTTYNYDENDYRTSINCNGCITTYKYDDAYNLTDIIVEGDDPFHATFVYDKQHHMIGYTDSCGLAYTRVLNANTHRYMVDVDHITIKEGINI